uniref:Farnesoic acid O-methyl transferase domain-containing protein n=1 Tax=Dendroctonus ponderosae TaxID=77166 RepID=J3JT96_DENPD|nr:unknown [Dendroctonus ponderosae]
MSNIELVTEDKLEYCFFPNDSGLLQFRVKAPHDAHVVLSNEAAEVDPMYEVFIGGWGNSKSIIRKNRTKPDVAEVPTPNILSDGEFRGFWIRWDDGTITVGREGDPAPFLSWADPERVRIEYIGVCTGWGASGNWVIQPPESSRGARSAGVAGGQCWVAASSGQVPPSAFAGGEDNGESIYVIRANFNGGLIPGKLIPSHGQAYVAWGGAENPIQEYEVLCDFPGQWQASSGGSLPPSAVPAGQSEDGETLYVGRVVHDGALTIGKVQPSHGVVYIPYACQELSFPDYEVLCS